MTRKTLPWLLSIPFALVGVIVPVGQARGAINLELRPSFQVVNTNSVVNLGLYAVSDSAVSQGMAAVQVIFNWQPSFLHFVQVDNTGAAPMLSSGVFASDPYGINEAPVPQDGTALYTGFANFGSPLFATPGGILLTTFRFQSQSLTTNLTPVDLLVSAGNPVGFTTVFDAIVPNLSVTGTLTGAGVRIVPAPASLALVGLLGGGVVARRRR